MLDWWECWMKFANDVVGSQTKTDLAADRTQVASARTMTGNGEIQASKAGLAVTKLIKNHTSKPQ